MITPMKPYIKKKQNYWNLVYFDAGSRKSILYMRWLDAIQALNCFYAKGCVGA